jgi:hypothetical protein
MNTDPQTIATPVEATRRKGNVARLPKQLRDKINIMLDDGVTYPEIGTELEKSTNPPLPHPISVNNLSNWFEGGYQDYLRNQAWRERMSSDADRYLEVAEDAPTKLVTGGLYASAIQICKLMDELTNPKGGETDAEKCARITNSLSRLSRSVLLIQQYRDKADKKPATPMRRGVTREELARITERIRL